MPPSRQQNAQDIEVQQWIENNQVDALDDFFSEYPELLEYNFIFYYDSGYGRGIFMDYTVLQQAVRKHKPDIVKMLLQKGANPNSGGLALTPPIFYAIYDTPSFRLLMDANASLELKNAYGDTLKKVMRQERGNPAISDEVRQIILDGRLPSKPIERNNYAFVEPNEANIFGEEMEDGTTVAYLDPVFRGQRIVAKRANGTNTNSWKTILKDRKNPWTRQTFDPSKVELQKVVVGPSVNLNGGRITRPKTRRSSKTLRKKQTRHRK